MIIIPTRVCNTNKCGYCGVLKKDFLNKFFQDNLKLKDFVEKIYFISKKTGDYNIRFFGGEPFLKFKIIKNIINSLKAKNSKFNYIINTNLSLLKNEHLDFLKNNNTKLIISCNGDLYSHCLTRNTNKDETIKLYENIKKIIDFGIKYQINIVTTPKISNRLYKNIIFINSKLGGENFNLLPVNYNGWDKRGLKEFEKQLKLIKNDIISNKLKIEFINKKVNNNVGLFNSEITIDSDGKIYPSMVIIENFFEKEKSNIQISDLINNISDIEKDFLYYEKDNHKIYDNFINKILNNKFRDIIENDKIGSKIFSNFLKEI